MTALQLNAELYRNLGIVAQDENMFAKVVKYVRRLAEQMSNDPTLMSKEDFFARVEEAEKQVERGEVYHFDDKQKMLDWLNSL